MFDYPYFFWLVAVSLGTPILATLGALAYTRWSDNLEPLWVTLPGYVIVHLLGLFLSFACGLDFDYFKYRRFESPLWTAAYYGGDVLILIGLAAVLWAGLTKRSSHAPRGFEVLRR